MKIKHLVTAIAMLALAGCTIKAADNRLPFYNTPDFTPVWVGYADEKATPMHTIAPFKMTDQQGSTVSGSTVSGKIYVASFFFGSCLSICPRIMLNLSMVQAAFAGNKRVMLLSYSVTPERDSIAALKQYAALHHIQYPQWRLLTGGRDEIYQLARKSYFAEEEIGTINSNNFLHTTNIVLVDGGGRIRGVYNGTLKLEINHLITHIRKLEAEYLQ